MTELEIGQSELILIAGKPGSRKSHLIKYLLMTQHSDYNLTPIRFIVVFTTTKFNRAYDSIMPADYVHSEYKPDILEELLKIQSVSGVQHQAAVIFDDCLPQAVFSSQLFLNLCTVQNVSSF